MAGEDNKSPLANNDKILDQAALAQQNKVLKKSAVNDSQNLTQQDSFDYGDVVKYKQKTYIVYDAYIKEGGTSSWIANNPGNIMASSEAENYNAFNGKYIEYKINGGLHRFAIFPSEEIGFAAIKKWLQHPKRINSNIQTVISWYAPATDGNDPNSYSSKVAKALNVPITHKIKDLNPEQLDIMATKIKEVEGWKPGRTLTYDQTQINHPSLPQVFNGRLPVLV